MSADSHNRHSKFNQYTENPDEPEVDTEFTMNYTDPPQSEGCSKTFGNILLILTGGTGVGTAVTALWLLFMGLTGSKGINPIILLGVLFFLVLSAVSFWALVRLYQFLQD